MYLPLDPNKVVGMWGKLSDSLSTNEFVFLINDNGNNEKANPEKLSQVEIDELISRMKKADYIRIGSSKMLPIPTHFAIELNENNEGKLTELILIDGSDDTIRAATHLIIQLSFFEIKNLKRLVIPFIITDITEPGVNVITAEDKNEMIITK